MNDIGLQAKRGAERVLTVVVVTYNRPSLLCEALKSLERQIDRSFDVLIFDNGSTDSTPDVVQTFLRRNPDWRSVRIDENWYSMKNVTCYVDKIRTTWVTYLCDDDLFQPDYMTYALPAIQRDNHGMVCFGFSTCDRNGKVLSSYTPLGISLNTHDALNSWGTRLLPQTAGISGFVFRTAVLHKICWDYPGGFFSDTRLVLEALADGGVFVIPQCVVTRRVWSGACSAPDPYSYLKRLTAHLQFIEDIRMKGDDFRTPYKRERRTLIQPIAFFRTHGVVLLDCETIPRSFIIDWIRFSIASPCWLGLQCLALTPLLIINRGPVKDLYESLRRWFRGIHLFVLSKH